MWRLDILGRSLKHLIEVMEDLQSQKVGFVSLQYGINKTTAGGRLMFHISGFERNLIRENTAMQGLPQLKPAQVKTLLKIFDSSRFKTI